MYLIQTPNFIQSMFPNFIWKVPDTGKRLFLTFDDGPIPEVTPWVLQQLDKYNAKGTFFCVGENVHKYPGIHQEVIDRGHLIGNHTYNHLSGWATENIPYFHNVRHCARLVDSDLFRPPYGRLKPKQVQFLSRHYKIVMWDVLSGDFDQKIAPDQVYRNVRENAKDGSIIVFHDSLKAKENLEYALPRVLSHFSRLGYQFDALSPEFLDQKALIRKSA